MPVRMCICIIYVHVYICIHMYKAMSKSLTIIPLLQSDYTFMFICSLIKPSDLLTFQQIRSSELEIGGRHTGKHEVIRQLLCVESKKLLKKITLET